MVIVNLLKRYLKGSKLVMFKNIILIFSFIFFVVFFFMLKYRFNAVCKLDIRGKIVIIINKEINKIKPYIKNPI